MKYYTVVGRGQEIIKINPVHIVSVTLGMFEDGEYSRYIPTSIELITGRIIQVYQSDVNTDNHDFMIEVFGPDWISQYRNQTSRDY